MVIHLLLWLRKMTTFTEKRFYEWHKDDKSVTLRHTGGSDGGGVRSINHLFYSKTTGSLCARDYKGIGSQYVDEGKLVIEVVN